MKDVVKDMEEAEKMIDRLLDAILKLEQSFDISVHPSNELPATWQVTIYNNVRYYRMPSFRLRPFFGRPAALYIAKSLP